MTCIHKDCGWPANYWLMGFGKRFGVCFGHGQVGLKKLANSWLEHK